MKKSRTVSSNIPKLSLSSLRTLIFFFKNIQSLQSRLQFCSLIQSFSNLRFTYLFLSFYIIEFLKFLNFFENSDLNRSLCVCVWRTLRIQRSSCCYLGLRWVTSASSPSQWRRNQRSTGPWVEPGPGRLGMRLWRPIEARNWRSRIRRTPRTKNLWIRRQRIWEIWAIRWARRKRKAMWWT